MADHDENLGLGFIRNGEKSPIGFNPDAWVSIRKNKMIKRKEEGRLRPPAVLPVKIR